MTHSTPQPLTFSILPASHIIIPEDRQRKTFQDEAITELMQSIATVGLLHAVVIRYVEGIPTLVSGETRLRAIIMMDMMGEGYRFGSFPIPSGHIPVHDIGSLSELEAYEAELEENIRRTSLSWQDEAIARERLHSLRAQQAAAVGDIQTIAMTAMEVEGRADGHFQDKVKTQIAIARRIADGGNPELAKASSLADAKKIMVKQATIEKNILLAKEFGSRTTSERYKLYEADCLQWLDSYDGELFDVILSDPPYGMNAQSFGDGAGKLTGTTHRYDDSPEAWRALMKAFIPLTFSKTKAQAHLYLFCDLDHFHELRELVRSAGWIPFRTPLIDFKEDSGRVPWPFTGPRRQYETILYAVKGDKPVTSIASDVIPCRADKQEVHGAQKPVSLYSNLLRRSCAPGDLVLDAFAGTGPILAAAKELNLRAVAVEKEEGAFATALKRLADLCGGQLV